MDKFLESAKANLTDQKFLFENLLFSIGPLTAIIAAKFGRRAWIKYEIVTTALLTLVLAFKPDFILSIVLNSPIKPFHHLLSAGYACYLVNIVLVPLFTLKSQDDSILYGHFYARILESSLIIIDNIVSYSEGGLHWNYKYLCFVTSTSLTYLAINIYFLSRTAKPSGQNPFKDLANSIGKIDFYIFLVSGIYVYAFPDRINLALAGSSVGVTNESFRSLTRSCGALILAMSLESFCMSEFKFIRDKKAFFLARLVASLLELAVFFSGFYCLRVYSLETFGCLASFSIVYQLFIFYGYYNTPQEHAKSH